jgi:hypothetical protein
MHSFKFPVKVDCERTMDYESRISCLSLTSFFCVVCKEVRGGKGPYAGNALKMMPIVPSPATFYDRERP